MPLTSADNVHTYNNSTSCALNSFAETTTALNANSDTDDNLNANIDGGDGNDFIVNFTSNVSIEGGKGNDSISSQGNNVVINAGDGNDLISLYGDEYASENLVTEGNGSDTLFSGKGDNTLIGGKGNDLFIYNAGKDVISDYTAGQDKIQIARGKISKTSLSGSDVIFTIGKGSLTVKNTKGKTISLIDSTGKASSTVVGSQTLTNSNKANVTIGADMGVVDASKRTKAIQSLVREQQKIFAETATWI